MKQIFTLLAIITTYMVNAQCYQKIDADGYHILAIKQDGTLWGWGSNFYNQLGQGGPKANNLPTQLMPDNNIVSIAAGQVHSVAIKSDGTLWITGQNNIGQLGLGNYSSVTNFTQVQGTNWAKASAGNAFTVAIKTDGTLWSWGYNNRGQLGIGNTSNSIIPVQVGTANNWSMVSAGENHVLALKTDGTLWAWGDNSSGKLGDATTTMRTSPVQIGTANDWVKISAGSKHSLAIKSNGTLWGWGSNSGKEFSLPNSTYTAPTQIGTDTNWTDISASNSFSLATKSNQTVFLTGKVDQSLISTGLLDGFVPKTTFTQIATASSLQAIAGSYFNYYYIDQNQLFSSGLDWQGQIGNGNSNFYPTKVSLANNNVSNISAAGHGLVVENGTGTVRAFGENDWYQIGDGTNVKKYTPVPIGLSNVKQVVTAFYRSFAIKNDGTLWAWGTNDFLSYNVSMFGNGSLAHSYTPIQIGSDADWKSTSTNFSHSLALKNNNTLWAWGYNAVGQLGNGTNTSSNTPIQLGSDTWKSIAAGSGHSLGVKSDGTLWAWGGNLSYTLGDGTNVNKNTPTQIGTANNWHEVFAGSSGSFAIKTDGTLWAWGNNTYGRLGIGSAPFSSVPVQIGTANNWVKISAGENHTLGLKSDGTIWFWGESAYGQNGMGLESFTSNTPQQIGTENNWSDIEAGDYQSYAVKTNGEIYAWGRNWSGGLGRTNFMNSFVNVSCYPSLSVNENPFLEKNKIKIYPNPTTETLNFSQEISNYTISDLSGRQILSSKNKTQQINVSDLKEGVYIISFEDENGNKQSQKFIRK